MNDLDRIRQQRRLRRTSLIIAWVLVGILGSSLAYNRLDVMWELLLARVPFGVSFMILVLLILFLFWQTWRNEGDIARQIRAHAEVLTEQQVREDESRRFVITGISAMKLPAFADETTLAAHLEAFGTDLDKAFAPAARDALDNWQQSVRFLRALPHIEALFVIDNDKGQFPRFRQLLLHFRPGLRVIRIENAHHRQPDYEDFEFCQASIRRGLQMIGKHAGLDPRAAEASTLIDVTPGQKTLSIAAAVASIRRNLIFVYVGFSGELRGYDVDLSLGGQGD
jgi:hypothetical protein